MSDAVTDLYAQLTSRPSYLELENALLDGVAAIQCLTAERNQLRSRLATQEQELLSLRATNEELRRQIAAIGDSYMRFATSCVGQLQQVSQVMQELESSPVTPSLARAG